MKIPLLQRIQSAARTLVRGSIAPFDRIGGDSGIGLTGDPMREPYRQSAYVYAAIRHISRPISAVSLQHGSSPRKSGNATLLGDPKLDGFWGRPARGLASLSEFILATVGWRKLVGESFWILGDDALLPFQDVRTGFPQMILARPDRMRHITDAGEIIGWEFTDGGGKSHALDAKQVIHLKQWNPYDDHRGLGELCAAMTAAETDHASGTFAKNLAQSNGDQGVYVVGKSGVIDDAQRKQLTALIREKRRLQQQGIFRPAFLTGDISIEDPKIRTVDAAFNESRRMSAAEIYVAFGVPPSMAKEAASYSIGSASDYYRLILDTCIPEASEIASGIATVSSLLMGRQVFAWWDWDEHPVMQEVRKERMGSVDALWSKGVPMRTISEYLDLGLPRFDGDQVGWLPMAVVPAGSAEDMTNLGAAASEPTTPPAPATESDPLETDVGDVAKAIQALRSRRAPSTTPAEKRLWQAHMRQRRGTITAYRSAFTRQLAIARAETLRKIASMPPTKGPGLPQDESGAVVTPPDSSEPEKGAAERGGGRDSCGVTQRIGAIDLIFSAVDFIKGLVVGFRKVSDRTLDTASDQLSKELGLDDPFRFPPEKAIQFFATRENRITGAGEETWNGIKAQLQAGMDAGYTTSQLADRVRAAFNEASKERATRIAMTETAAAYGYARHEGMKQAGVTYKRWLTSGADNVRPAHADANNQTVLVDDPFTVGGEDLMHPGDVAGSPWNVINCHCVAVAVKDQDEGLNV